MAESRTRAIPERPSNPYSRLHAAATIVGTVALVVAAVYLVLVERGQRQVLAELREVQSLLRAGGSQRTSQPSAQPQPSAANAFPPDLTLGVDAGAVKGSADAKLTIVEFSDFECPFCGRYSRETLPQIVRDYVNTGRIRYAFRHFPVERLHPNAVKASEAAECGRRQERFWPLHDRFFENPKALSAGDLMTAAKSAGADMSSFQSCLGGQATAKVRQDLELGVRAGVTGTPAFFIGDTQPDGSVRVRRKLTGAHTFESFKTVLDGLLGS